MNRRVLRVSAARFVAGAVWVRTDAGWRCERAAPIIKWMRDMTPKAARERLNQAGFSWEWMDE